MGILDFITPQFIAAVLVVLLPLLFWGFNFIILYHLLRFGIGVQPKRLAAVYFIGSSVLFCLAILFFVNMDALAFKDEALGFIKNYSFFTIY